MSASFGMNRFNISSFGVKVQVPNNNIARLMYYLNCICVVIDYDRNLTLTDYQHYYKLNRVELKTLYDLVNLFDPKIFINAGIFIIDSNLLPNDLSNQFYKITDEKIGFHVNENVLIGGKDVKVLNVMACDWNWLSENYYTPLKKINRYVPGQQISPLVDTDSLPVSVPVIVREYTIDPVTITCPSCKHLITTKTKPRINCIACCCFLFFCLWFVFAQIFRGKSICCLDVIHSCPNCGSKVGEYNSC